MYADGYTILTPSFGMQFVAAKATHFESAQVPSEQLVKERVMPVTRIPLHLDLKLTRLSDPHPMGVLPEIWGIADMSAKTEKMLYPPEDSNDDMEHVSTSTDNVNLEGQVVGGDQTSDSSEAADSNVRSSKDEASATRLFKAKSCSGWFCQTMDRLRTGSSYNDIVALDSIEERDADGEYVYDYADDDSDSGYDESKNTTLLNTDQIHEIEVVRRSIWDPLGLQYDAETFEVQDVKRNGLLWKKYRSQIRIGDIIKEVNGVPMVPGDLNLDLAALVEESTKLIFKVSRHVSTFVAK